MNLPAVKSAKLPDTYQAAKHALAECARIDECKEWQKKAEALASYAKQAEDESLFRLATKIKGRAVRRCGELLKAIEGAQGKRTDKLCTAAGTRSKAAKEAGLSKRQKDTALRVASIPDDEFEELVESDAPPTVTQLAERGKRSKPVDILQGRSKKDFQASMYGLGAIQQLLKEARKYDPKSIAAGTRVAKEKRDAIAATEELIPWLKAVAKELEK